MKILMIILSGVALVNNQPSKEQFEVITGKQIVEQGYVPVVAKKATTKKKSTSTSGQKKKKIKKSTVKKTKKKVVKSKKKKKTTYKQTTRVRYNKGEIQAYAHELVRQYGWNEDDYNALVLLWYRESGWNPNAVNKKSGACGIPQSLPCKKMASEGADYRTNYKTQVRWGLKYIKARYQTPKKAWAFWQKHHWY